MPDWRAIASGTRLLRAAVIIHTVAGVIALLVHVGWTFWMAAKQIPEGGARVTFKGLAPAPIGLSIAEALAGITESAPQETASSRAAKSSRAAN